MRITSRKLDAFFYLLSFILFFVSGSLQAEEQKRPNLLLIVADDLGYGDLACYGADDMRTPVLDQLANEGMKFDNFYANCPVCSPTRASLMTGCYPDRVGVPGVVRTNLANSWGYMTPEVPLISNLLADTGYKTSLIGKWHLGLEAPNRPTDRGFDHFHGWLGDMMDDYYKHRRHDINYMRLNEKTIDDPGHATDLFSQWASAHLRKQNAEEPFFMYLAYNAPHTPIQPPADWVVKVRKREPNISEKRAKLVALIEHMDAGIGEVLTTLKETGLDKNTLVFFTSDNGGHLRVGANNGGLRDGKQSMYEGGLRVPAIARWPENIAASSASNFTATTMDVFSTLLAAAKTKQPTAVDGRSFLPTLKGQVQPELRDEMYFVRREGGQRYGGKTIEALRWKEWKLVANSPFAPMELFNLKDDPQEKFDLMQQRPKVAQELSVRLRKHIQRGGQVPWQRPE